MEPLMLLILAVPFMAWAFYLGVNKNDYALSVGILWFTSSVYGRFYFPQEMTDGAVLSLILTAIVSIFVFSALMNRACQSIDSKSNSIRGTLLTAGSYVFIPCLAVLNSYAVAMQQWSNLNLPFLYACVLAFIVTGCMILGESLQRIFSYEGVSQ